MTVAGTLAAVTLPIYNITDFLYLIGSVFAPMIAIQIADFFLMKRDSSKASFDWAALAVWLFGFILYRILMGIDIPVGNTLPDMVVTMAVCAAVRKLTKQ